MLSHPFGDDYPGDEGASSEVPQVLSLSGGAHTFLEWGGEQVAGGVWGREGARILRAQKVVRADVWLKTGLLRPLRGSHLTWSHSSGTGKSGFTASLLLLPN